MFVLWFRFGFVKRHFVLQVDCLRGGCWRENQSLCDVILPRRDVTVTCQLGIGCVITGVLSLSFRFDHLELKRETNEELVI